ncbi:hypothetical protein MKX03_020505 [Papaver bracteatum]|nr:hypothetical protein MKX03_020505 [Papaver bracteatum]
MRGCLCLAYEYEFYGDLWMLKKQENAVTSEFYNAKDQYYKSRKWSKEIEIPYEGLNHTFKIFGLTKEGAAILKHEDGSMTLYHPKFNARVGDSTFIQLISHINSFVSLKALGEVNVATPEGYTDDNVATPIGYTDDSDGGRRRKRKKKRKRTRAV